MLILDGRLGKIKGPGTIAVVGESTVAALKMIAAHHGACEASLAPQLLDERQA